MADVIHMLAATPGARAGSRVPRWLCSGNKGTSWRRASADDEHEGQYIHDPSPLLSRSNVECHRLIAWRVAEASTGIQVVKASIQQRCVE